MHRHRHRRLGSVYALKTEVDAWREARTSEPPAAAASGGEAAAALSIAVLPFANLSPDAGKEYFAEGMTAEVTTMLAKVRTLRVISSSSSRLLRGTAKPARTIAGQLGVRYLVEGSVRCAGPRLRIAAQLIDASNDRHLWADAFSGTIDDVFLIQERLARVIVKALELRLTAQEVGQLAGAAPMSLAAYECYLRARHQLWRWRKDAIDLAVDQLQQGLTIIGDNARLYAALGVAHLQYREAGIDFTERPLRNAESSASKLLELEGDSAPARLLRGWIRYSRGRVQDAVRDLKAALETEPNNADTLLLLCNCYLISGRVSSARPLLARLLAIDPLTPLTRCMPAYADVLEGNFAAAVEPYRQMFEMDPSNPMARLFYAWVLMVNRRTNDMAAIVDTMPRDARDTIPGRIALFFALALRRKLRGMHGILTPQTEIAAGATDVFPRLLAQGFALAGMTDPALRWLAIAVDRGFINYPFLAHHDPFFASLRNDERFTRILAVVRDRWLRFED